MAYDIPGNIGWIAWYRFFPVCSADRSTFREGDAGLKTCIFT